jgi:hypothetical protein
MSDRKSIVADIDFSEEEIKELIKKKKHLYGDSFNAVAQEYGTDPIEVIELMYLIKSHRLGHLSRIEQEHINKNLILPKDIREAIIDTVFDMECYLWIKNNYEEYQAL